MQESTITLTAQSYFGGIMTVRFDESGWQIVADTRKVSDGYLHIDDTSPADITRALRDTLIRYLYSHGPDMPGLGRTVQVRYFAGLSLAEREAIGNNGRHGVYA